MLGKPEQTVPASASQPQGFGIAAGQHDAAHINERPDLLLFCGGFFGYAAEIKRHLEARGRCVALFDDRPASDSVTKALIRIAPGAIRSRTEQYFDRIIAQMSGEPIRDVLVIKAEGFSPDTVTRLRAAFPLARFTLYFWDSFGNMPSDSREKAALFDRVLTFDPRDAERDQLIYRPLFFADSYAKVPVQTQDIDLLFFGTIHDDRFRVLQKISKSLPDGLTFRKILYFPAKWLYAVHAFRDPGLLWADKRDFIFFPKSRSEIVTLLARSRIVIDIERPVQRGYTMRTLESLGAGRKVITTNSEAKGADFYNPANIAVIDRNAPRITEEFLAAPFEPLPASMLYYYSLEGWLDDVLP